LNPLGAEWEQAYPWNSLLFYAAGKCFIPPEPSEAIKTAYRQHLADTVRTSGNEIKAMPELPAAFLEKFVKQEGCTGVYGRSLFTQAEGEARCYRIKLRKRTSSQVEALEELTREAGVLGFLREQQALFQSSGSGQGMDIRSRLPVPLGNFGIKNPESLLALPAAKKGRLEEQVATVEGTGPLPGYLFHTASDELYHRYVHESEGALGLSRDNSLKGLQLAAHDIGVLFRHGLSVENMLPAYHNNTCEDTREYFALNQLHSCQSQG
ncbi:hypothetical protein M3P05_20555, partial [Sansalvadorimonas sp. 2012CJ34-2]